MVKVLALIPCKSHSRRMPNKNTTSFCGGPPLVYWTMKAAEDSNIDKAIVSCDSWSDIYNMENLPKLSKVEFVDRPLELAKDDTSTIDVILHHIKNFPEYDVIMLLQCTSPLRKTHHINEALKQFKNDLTSDCLISVDKNYNENGAIYIARREFLEKHKTWYVRGSNTSLYVMSNSSSIDINTLEQFCIAEAIQKEIDKGDVILL